MNKTEQDEFDLPSWRFRIANLGCVESGELEVKPLTLLCGPNNTGKTWVMYALYGFLRGFNDWLAPLPGVDEIVEALKEKRGYCWDFEVWLRNHAEELNDQINRHAKRGLPEIFNASENEFTNTRFDFIATADEWIDCGLRLGINLSYESGFELEVHKHPNDARIRIKNIDAAEEELWSCLYAIVAANLLPTPSVFAMPAERNGLHLFFRELRERRTNLLHPAYRMLLKTNPDIIGSRYSLPIAGYIDWLNSLGSKKRNKGSFPKFSERIKTLIDGDYDVDADGNISFTPNSSTMSGDNGHRLDLHLASSTVNSLFGLWFYLEHQAKPGDVLMIDEPELNLHPANQRAVARLLARLVNAGIRVVCSTHSDYIVREINSLIMLARPHPKRDELMQRFGYEEEEILKPEQVGAYLFDHNRIEAMPITEDEGIIATTFDEQIHQLNETSDEIYYTYRDSGAEEAA
jgi:hypothetical protein